MNVHLRILCSPILLVNFITFYVIIDFTAADVLGNILSDEILKLSDHTWINYWSA